MLHKPCVVIAAYFCIVVRSDGLESLQIALFEGMREVCGIIVVRSDGLQSLQIALFEGIREVCGIRFRGVWAPTGPWSNRGLA